MNPKPSRESEDASNTKLDAVDAKSDSVEVEVDDRERLNLVRNVFGGRSVGYAKFQSPTTFVLPNSEKAGAIFLIYTLHFDLVFRDKPAKDSILLKFSERDVACRYEMGMIFDQLSNLTLLYEEDVLLHRPNVRSRTNYRFPSDAWKAKEQLSFVDKALLRFRELGSIEVNATASPASRFTRER